MPDKQKKTATGEETTDTARSSIEQRLNIPVGMKVHPVIAALEKVDESAVVIDGFLGTGQDAVVRLYQALDTSIYVELPKEAIIHVEADKSELGAVRVFVRASSEILSVRRERVRAGVYTQGPRPPTFPPVQPAPTFWTCAAGWESEFASQASAILLDESSCLTNPNQTPAQEARCLDRIEMRKQMAKEALHRGLVECLAKHGRPFLFLSLEEVYSSIVTRYLERPDSIRPHQ